MLMPATIAMLVVGAASLELEAAAVVDGAIDTVTVAATGIDKMPVEFLEVAVDGIVPVVAVVAVLVKEPKFADVETPFSDAGVVGAVVATGRATGGAVVVGFLKESTRA
jgi:hypothetical protein